jgi:hypothetical protein
MASTAHHAPAPDYSIGPASRRRGHPAGPEVRPGWPAAVPAVAGFAYVAAWLGGLAAWPANLALNATATQAAASYAAHPAEAAVQYLLVEGVAGVLLAIVLGCTLLPRLRDGGSLRVKGAAVLGAAAVVTSLTQCAIGLVIASMASGRDAARISTLSDLVNQLDGGKMLALAAVAAVLATLAAPGAALPGWLRAAGLALAVALVVSACAYLALWQPLAWSAYVSGPLLLLWVAGLGIVASKRARTAAVH